MGSSDTVDNERLMTTAETTNFCFTINKPWNALAFFHYLFSAEAPSKDLNPRECEWAKTAGIHIKKENTLHTVDDCEVGGTNDRFQT